VECACLGEWAFIAEPRLRYRSAATSLDKGLIMSIEPEDDDTERETDQQARAMMAKLRKDVDSWSKARRESIADSTKPVEIRSPARKRLP